SKKKRTYDYYSPGGVMGKRPDRAVIVYCNRIREAYGEVPIIIGGLEASLRRFAHYDYWDNKVRRSILIDARADLLSYGMGEKSILRIAKLLDKGVPVKKIKDVRGTVYLTSADDTVHYPCEKGESSDVLKTDKSAYARSFGMQYRNQDAISGKAITEYYDQKMLVQNPPMPVLEREELDKVYALPYTRAWHPSYKEAGGVPAINEVEFSITHNRGCFGSCNFCALAFHQGRAVRSRSEESVLAEAQDIVSMPGFKGYIHDVGGPTANFRYPACDKQVKYGVCPDKRCLAPKPCPNMKVDHSEYARLLRRVAAIPGVKKVFVRSGIRFDYLIYDQDETFFKQLVEHHISGQLKVAPEHICQGVLGYMGKPPVQVYDRFKKRYFELTKAVGKEQYLVPYLMSSHPGSTLADAVELALYLKRSGYSPEQVQDYYPTPGTVSTCMYYTGLDPLTMKQVEITDDYQQKRLQRALLQYNRPENRELVCQALKAAGREDLIGYGKECLVRPVQPVYRTSAKNRSSDSTEKRSREGRTNGVAGRKQIGQNGRGSSDKKYDNRHQPKSNKKR
ncbi:MAG: YgiQ family radical SAM protein, partial [Clostridia bacterium]|nr:YgiQ family radical SAM protein [Clostridia bacterium]